MMKTKQIWKTGSGHSMGLNL